MILEIRTDGDPVLRGKARPVRTIDAAMLKLASNMLETMYDAPGVGLAAPQVGVALRLIVVDAGDGPRTLFNPAVVAAKGEDCSDEGCLSVPGMVGRVKRAAEVDVEAYDRRGRRVAIQAQDLLARVLQHEIDHLDGVLFTDKAENVHPVEESDGD
ncbi:MAG: peptide deformylase [Clostridia bacterium]|nr:peptide deformylase [Clostridia bacterium]